MRHSLFRAICKPDISRLDPFLPADCALAAAFQFARFGGVEIDPKFQHLAQWDTRYRERPIAKSVLSL